MYKFKHFIYGILICLSLSLSISIQAQSATPEMLANVVDCFTKLDDSNNFTDNLQHVDMNNLPMGIKKTISNMDVTLAVNSVGLTSSDYTEIGVYLRIKIPEQGKSLFFGGQNIKLSHNGDIVV